MPETSADCLGINRDLSAWDDIFEGGRLIPGQHVRSVAGLSYLGLQPSSAQLVADIVMIPQLSS